MGGSRPSAHLPCCLAQAWLPSASEPPPLHPGASEKLKPELLGLIRQQRSAPPLRGTPSTRSAVGGARVTVWAVVGWREAGQSWGGPLIAPRPLPLPPTDKLWFCCSSPTTKCCSTWDVEEGEPADPWRARLEQREEAWGQVDTCAPEPPPTPGLPGVSVVNQPFPAVPGSGDQALPQARTALTSGEKVGKQNKVSAVVGARVASHQPPAQRSWIPAFPGCLGVSFLSQL